LSNLDAKLRLRLRDDLRRIIKKSGVTALYVTHDQSEAVALGDRIGVMRDGKLLQLASADAIYNRPVDLFVAFHRCLQPARRARAGAAGRFRRDRDGIGRCRLGPSPHGVAAAEHRRGRAGDGRGAPRECALRRRRRRPRRSNRFTARVLALRFEGVQTVYELGALGHRIAAVEIGTSTRHPVGSTLDVTLPPASCWAYPADDGAALA